jgi:hypothetical protein
VDFRNDFFVLGYKVRPVILIPFDPVFPHLYYFLAVEFSRDAEPRNRVYVGEEILLCLETLILCSEYFDDFLLVGTHLRQLTVAHVYGVAS